MIDYIGYMVQGLFTGIGVGVANYIHANHITKKFKAIEKKIKKIIKK